MNRTDSYLAYFALGLLGAAAACGDDEPTNTTVSTTATSTTTSSSSTGGMGGADGGGGAANVGGGGSVAEGGGGATGGGGAAPGSVVLNEIEASADDGATPDTDWIELYNASASAVDVSGLCFRDDSLEVDHVFQIPAGTTIEAGGYLTFVQDATDSFTFGLGAGGDAIFLYDGCTIDEVSMTVTLGNLIDETTWADQGDGSWGRLPNGTGAFANIATPTFGAENN